MIHIEVETRRNDEVRRERAVAGGIELALAVSDGRAQLLLDGRRFLFPNGIERRRGIGRVGAARLILGARSRFARCPAEEGVAVAGRSRTAERQSDVLRFRLRSRCAAAGVRVVAHGVGHGQRGNALGFRLLAHGAGIGLDAGLAGRRRCCHGPGVPGVIAGCGD